MVILKIYTVETIVGGEPEMNSRTLAAIPFGKQAPNRVNPELIIGLFNRNEWGDPIRTPNDIIPLFSVQRPGSYVLVWIHNLCTPVYLRFDSFVWEAERAIRLSHLSE
jgi:hypothetical protein